MKKIIIFLACTLCIGFVSANEPEDNKTDLINELIEATNALDYATSMSDMVVSSIQQQSGLAPELSVIIADEIKKIMREELIENGFVLDLMHRLYKKHFTLAELKKIVAFYQSDAGKKAASVLPSLSQEAMQITQQHMATINPKLQKRLFEVIQAEQMK